MTSPLQAYLDKYPQQQGKERADLLEELYQTSGADVPFDQFAEKVLSDPDDPLSYRSRLRIGQKREPFTGSHQEGVGDKSFFKPMVESAVRAFKAPGEVWKRGMEGKPMPPSEIEDEAKNMAGWVTPVAPARVPFAKSILPPPGEAWRIGKDHPLHTQIVPYPDRVPGELMNHFDRLYEQVKDQFHALNVGEKKLTGRYSGSSKSLLAAEESPHRLAAMTKGNPGRLEQWVENGTMDFTSQTVSGPGLRQVINPVKDQLTDAINYAVNKRAIEKAGQDIKTGIEFERATAEVKLVEDAARGGDVNAQSIVQFQKDLSSYNDRLLQYARDSGLISKEGYGSIRAANMDYIPFYRLLDESMMKGTPPGRNPTNLVKRMEGSDAPILDPIESVIRNTYAFIQAAEGNRVRQALYRLVTRDDTKGETVGNLLGKAVNTPMKAVEASDQELMSWLNSHGLQVDNVEPFKIFRPKDYKQDNMIAAMIDGKQKWMQVDHDIARAFSYLDKQTVIGLEKILGYPAQWLRAGVTLDPGFSFRNFFRDQFAPLVTLPFGKYIPFWDPLRHGIPEILQNGKFYQQWLGGGGANANRVSIDQAYLSVARQKLAGSMAENAGRRLNPMEAMRYVSNLMENATRVSSYRRLRMNGYDHFDAIFMSRNSTLDFARMGESMRHLNTVTAFQNAQMEGVDRVVRAFIDNPGKAATALGAGITLPSVALWALNHDDPRYQQLERWKKDIYWVIPTNDWQDVSDVQFKTLKSSLPVRTLPSGKLQANFGSLIMVPKPFEIGVMFGSVPERSLEAFFKANPKLYAPTHDMLDEVRQALNMGKGMETDEWLKNNPEVWKGVWSSIKQAFLPQVMPTFAAPFIETTANWSYFYDRPIEGEGTKRRLPEDRYTEFTSETAKAISKVLTKFGDLESMSPQKVEYWVRGWSGHLGRHFLEFGGDPALEAVGIAESKVKPEKRVTEYPFFRDFFHRYPASSALSIRDFYELREKQEQVKASMRFRERREGSKESAEALKADKKIVAVEDTYQALNNIWDQVQRVWQNPAMTPADKRQLIDKITFMAIAIAKEGVAKIRVADEDDLWEHKERNIPKSDKDERLNSFARIQSAAGQTKLMQQYEVWEQLRFAPYLHQKARKDFQVWYMEQSAENQEVMLSLTDLDTLAYWLPFSRSEVKAMYGDQVEQKMRPSWEQNTPTPGMPKIEPEDMRKELGRKPAPPPPPAFEFKPSWQ